jgi:hypothetical protein
VKRSICPSDAAACRALFGRSLFVFGEFGGNDYSFAWKADWSLEKVKTTLVPAVVASLVSGVERLLDEGARHVVVPGNLPAGCIPITLTMYPSEDRSEYDPRTGCLKKFNSVALYHNAMLRIALDRLQRRRPESRVVYADYYTPYIQFARTPHLYGQSSVLHLFFLLVRFGAVPGLVRRLHFQATGPTGRPSSSSPARRDLFSRPDSGSSEEENKLA